MTDDFGDLRPAKEDDKYKRPHKKRPSFAGAISPPRDRECKLSKDFKHQFEYLRHKHCGPRKDETGKFRVIPRWKIVERCKFCGAQRERDPKNCEYNEPQKDMAHRT